MLTRKPATHPDESNPQHKANLVRNLGRNDAEIAAIVQCNRSLRTLRDAIRQRHGEATLLDVGEGTIRLRTGELGSTVCPAVVRAVPGVIVDADGYRKLVEDRMAEVMKERALRQAAGGNGKADDDDDDEAAANATEEADAADGAAADSAVIHTIPPDEVPLDDPDHASDPTNPQTRTNLIRAFLLRLHLRRRLLNRLFRRMNRLARAMDGESAISSGLNGPTPPRYGDFRFLLDETGDEFRQFEAHFQRKVEARRNVEERRALRRNREIGLLINGDDDAGGARAGAGAGAGGEEEKMKGGNDEVMADDNDNANTADAEAKPKAAPTSSSSSHSGAAAKLILPQEDVGDLNVLMETDVGRDKLVTYQDLTKPLQALGGGGSPNKSKTPAAAAAAKKKSSTSSKMDVEETAAKTEAIAADIDAEAAAGDGAKTEGPPSAIEVKAESTEENGVANGTSDTPAVKADDDNNNNNKADEEEELPPLPELVPGKIRKIVTLPLASSDPAPEERDFASSKFTAAGGGGIGAFNRSMNSREREVEFNRWKTDVLAKVPEQPTFAELGLENRVFGLEARRKKAAEAAVVAAIGDDKMEVDDDKAAADDAMDVDDGDKSRKRFADDANEGKEGVEKEGGDNGADKSKEGAGEEKIKRPDIFKKKKLISLAAAPSFHMQDQHRVREVHKELLVRSRHEKTQKLVEEANAAYNKAYAVSTEVHNRKNQRTNELNALSTHFRTVEFNANATHQATTNAQRALWQKAYEQWCSRRMNAGLAVPPMPVEQQAPPAAAAATQNGNGAATPTSGANTRPGAANGTPLTAAKSSDSAATEEEREAASALGAVVDKVAKEESEEKKEPVYNDPTVLENVPAEAENFPAFTAPPMNADLAAALAKERQKEVDLRKKVTEDTIKLNAAEEERKKAWRLMLKLKGELQTATAGGSTGSGSRSQRSRPAASRRAPAPAAATYRAPAPAARAPVPAATAFAGHSAAYGQAQQVQQNYAHSQAAMAAYQAQASAASAARAPTGAANYYGYGYPQQQQQYIPTQQTSRPGIPTAPTGTMAMAAAAGAAATAPTAAAAAVAAQQPQQQQVPAQATQQALAAYQAQQPQVQVAAQVAAAAPAAASSTNSVTHQQRYSQEAIRNRTYGDGSVAPAVPPKRDDNGLFQRPSGRSRKGMDWDAVHGVWRPSLGGGMS